MQVQSLYYSSNNVVLVASTITYMLDWIKYNSHKFLRATWAVKYNIISDRYVILPPGCGLAMPRNVNHWAMIPYHVTHMLTCL
jgi:hypothetical protein